MANILGAIGSIESSFNSIGGLAAALAGQGGSAGVTLGGVSFTDLECPEKINFGGSQQVTVHKLPGGTRVFDLMGPDDADIEWTGFLVGSGAASKGRQLDQMRIAGTTVTLTWPGFTRQVVIRSFECDYQRAGYWLPYRLVCAVVATPQPPGVRSSTSILNSVLGPGITNAITSVSSTIGAVANTVKGAVTYVQGVVGAATAVISPIATLAGVNIGGPLSKIQTALGTASGIANAAGGIANAPAAIASTITSLQTASTNIQAGIAQAGTVISNIFTGAPSGSVIGGVTDLNNAAAATGMAAGLTQANGFVNQAGAAAQRANTLAPPSQRNSFGQ